MQHYILADDIAADADTAVVYVANNDATEYGLMQVTFGGGTGNVLVQGRIDASMPWETITTKTANGMERITSAPEMRVSANTLAGATVRVIFRA